MRYLLFDRKLLLKHILRIRVNCINESTHSINVELQFLQIRKYNLGFSRNTIFQEILYFNLDQKKADHGWVYIWLEINKDEVKVVYVGKAGKTLQQRCQEHRRGFKNSVTGKAHAERIREGIKMGKHYELWSRKAQVTTLFEEENISMVEIEERAFIQKFCPAWNKI
ncbi:GIY-YIG nuclease family protein [Aquaspirillum serpens]|uniref:GIY-YIG nuclease family protein n=1 Tax=Aquaspirillum serpens TaxID=190 RepID=UPI0012DEBDF1|nr:GIY-YIG nuclease family protein [Aquaspirillum serpens]